MNILKINLTTIVLCLGLAGYMSATDGIYAKAPSVEQEAQKMEFTIPVEYNQASGSWNWSPYSVSKAVMSVSTLLHATADTIFPDQPGFFIRLIHVPLEWVGMVLAHKYISTDCQRASPQFPMLDRLIMLQNFRYGELDWRLYWLTGTAVNGLIHDLSWYLVALNPMCWVSLYAVLYNYLWRGKSVTMLSHWGEVKWMPCFWLYLDKNKKVVTRLDNYIGYRDRTFLIGLSAYVRDEIDEDEYGQLNVLLKTDRLLSFFKGRYTVDTEAGIGWDEANGWVGWLLGVQSKFRLHKYVSLEVAGSYKTPGFQEGITASGDRWTLSGGITLHM